MTSPSIQHLDMLSEADLSVEDPHPSPSPTIQNLGHWNLTMTLTYSSPETAARAMFIMEHPLDDYSWKENLEAAHYTLTPTSKGTGGSTSAPSLLTPTSKGTGGSTSADPKIITCSSDDTESRVTESGRRFVLFEAKNGQWDQLGLAEYESLSFFGRRIIERTLDGKKVIVDFTGKVVAELASTALESKAATF